MLYPYSEKMESSDGEYAEDNLVEGTAIAGNEVSLAILEMNTS